MPLWFRLKNKHLKPYTKYNNIHLKLITTRKAKPFQPYVSLPLKAMESTLTIEKKIFLIDSMVTDNGQESAMLLEM